MEAVGLHARGQQLYGREKDFVLVPLEASGDYLFYLFRHEISEADDEFHEF